MASASYILATSVLLYACKAEQQHAIPAKISVSATGQQLASNGDSVQNTEVASSQEMAEQKTTQLAAAASIAAALGISAVLWRKSHPKTPAAALKPGEVKEGTPDARATLQPSRQGPTVGSETPPLPGSGTLLPSSPLATIPPLSKDKAPLPAPRTLKQGVERLIQDTIPRKDYKGGSSQFGTALEKAHVRWVTPVRGNGDCGFYSVYAGIKSKEGLSEADLAKALGDEAEVNAWVAAQKKAMKASMVAKMGSSANFKKDIALSLSEALAELLNPKGIAAAKENIDAVRRSLQTSKELGLNPEQSKEFAASAELAAAKARIHLDHVAEAQSLELPSQQAALSAELRKKSPEELWQLYEHWILDKDYSPATLEGRGLEVLSELVGYKLQVQARNGQEGITEQEFGTGPKGSILLINTGAHFDLGHR